MATARATVTLDTDTLKNGSSGDAVLTVTAIDPATIPALAQAVFGDRPAIAIKLSVGGAALGTAGNKDVAVELPYELGPGEQANKLVACFVDADGGTGKVDAKYDGEESIASFDAEKFGIYAIGYRE